MTTPQPIPSLSNSASSTTDFGTSPPADFESTPFSSSWPSPTKMHRRTASGRFSLSEQDLKVPESLLPIAIEKQTLMSTSAPQLLPSRMLKHDPNNNSNSTLQKTLSIQPKMSDSNVIESHETLEKLSQQALTTLSKEHKRTLLNQIIKELENYQTQESSAQRLFQFADFFLTRFVKALNIEETQDSVYLHKLATVSGQLVELIFIFYIKSGLCPVTSPIPKRLKELFSHSFGQLKQLNNTRFLPLGFALDFNEYAIEKLTRVEDLFADFISREEGTLKQIIVGSSAELNFKEDNWFEGAFLCRVLARKAKENPTTYFKILTTLISQKYLQSDWRFTYQAIITLCDMIESHNDLTKKENVQTQKLCLAQLMNIAASPIFKPPVLTTAERKQRSNSMIMSLWENVSEMMQIPPKKPDEKLREQYVRILIKLSKLNNNPSLVAQSKNQLYAFWKNEKDPDIKYLLDNSVPTDAQELNMWLKGTTSNKNSFSPRNSFPEDKNFPVVDLLLSKCLGIEPELIATANEEKKIINNNGKLIIKNEGMDQLINLCMKHNGKIFSMDLSQDVEVIEGVDRFIAMMRNTSLQTIYLPWSLSTDHVNSIIQAIMKNEIKGEKISLEFHNSQMIAIKKLL